MSHTISIVTEFKYWHSDPKSHMYSIEVSGDGDIDHYLQAFRTALLAAGFTTDLIDRLVIQEK